MNKNQSHEQNLVIYHNSLIRVTLEPSEIPWLIIYIQRSVKEVSQCTDEEKNMLFCALDIIEKAMLQHYKPDKINIASFGNILPQVHYHIMARFHDDGFFPQPMWGIKQRESTIHFDNVDFFCSEVQRTLDDKLA
ncbi:MAG: HIT family protein [Coxiellaceae bacterium]|nr:HIT family protein [Coxiellaceae bacterium]|tara:strand:- start:4978 stop:5382 length:405 start_codon:yes stop_codon:yes gene_type:complete